MNLLISLPAGILLIMLVYYLLTKVYKGPVYVLGGILALVVAMVYSMLAAISWPGADVFAIHLALYMLTVYGMSMIYSQRRKKTDGTKSKLHWAPVSLFVFFGIILVTDSVLILLAQSGMSPEWVKRILPEPRSSGEVRSIFPGTVSHDFREKSTQFNEYQQQHKRQAELGWSVRLGWKEVAYSGKRNTLFVEIRNRDGRLLTGADVVARFLYPGDMKLDQTHQLTSKVAGLYQADVTLMNAGDWDMVLNVEHETGRYEMRTRTTILQQGTQ
jgi:nitrogen fixation protein FixH